MFSLRTDVHENNTDNARPGKKLHRIDPGYFSTELSAFENKSLNTENLEKIKSCILYEALF
jgi:hypothetical protein